MRTPFLSDDPARVTEWIYQGIWGVLVRWFRVPEQPPTLPVMEGETILAFRPAPGYLRYLKFQFWILLTIVDAGLLFLWGVIAIAAPIVAVLITPIALAAIIMPDIIAYLAIHLRFDTTWYVLTDRSLRIRSGIWILRETTITFENVQNVSVDQGPLQRYFGIANVMLQTAGGGATGGQEAGISFGHHGLLAGVDNAAEIRDLILNRLKRSKSAGVSDEDHGPFAPVHSDVGEEHLSTLREIRDITARWKAFASVR